MRVRACAGKSKTHVVTTPHAQPRTAHVARTHVARARAAPRRPQPRTRRRPGATLHVRDTACDALMNVHTVIGAVRPACRPRCPTGRFEDERLSSCVDELMRLYRAVWRAGVSSHARRPPAVAGGTSPGSRVVASITICLHCSSSCSNSQTSTRCSNNRSNTRCSNSQSNNRLRNKRSNAADGRHCP